MRQTKRFVISKDLDVIVGTDAEYGDRIYVILRVIEGKKVGAFGITIPELEAVAKALHDAKGDSTFRLIVAEHKDFHLVVQHSEKRSSILIEQYETDNTLRIYEAPDPREEFHTKLDAVLSAIDEMEQSIAKELGVALSKVREHDGREAGTSETPGEPYPNASQRGTIEPACPVGRLDSQSENPAEAQSEVRSPSEFEAPTSLVEQPVQQ